MNISILIQKNLIFLICLAVASLGTAQDNSLISLDGDWHFKTEAYNKGVQEKWFSEDFEEGSWGTMKVPGNWNLENEYAEYSGKARYKRQFKVPNNQQGKISWLKFGGLGPNRKI